MYASICVFTQVFVCVLKHWCVCMQVFVCVCKYFVYPTHNILLHNVPITQPYQLYNCFQAPFSHVVAIPVENQVYQVPSVLCA